MIERKMLSLETTALLDKLYNLRGEDSVILVEMDKQKSKAEETKTRTSAEKIELQGRITDLENDHTNLNTQGERLADLLSSIDRNDYSTVLDRLEIDFEPVSLKDKLDQLLPETIKKVENEIEEAKQKLATVEDEMMSAETTIQELGIRKDQATSNQLHLNEYFNLALNGNISITRDEITALLIELNLSEDEAREGAKLLMFPEDALYEYDRRYSKEPQTGKSISEVLAEANAAVEEKEETVVENNVIEEESNTEESFEIADIDSEEITNEEIEEEVVVNDEEQADENTDFEESINASLSDDSSEEIKKILADHNIDFLDISSDDMAKIVDNYDGEIIKNNIETVKKHSIDTDMLVDNVSLLYDKELSDKINLLISVGKEPLDIYFNAKVLVKYDFKGLSDAIELLKENGLEPKKVPLMAY